MFEIIFLYSYSVTDPRGKKAKVLLLTFLFRPSKYLVGLEGQIDYFFFSLLFLIFLLLISHGPTHFIILLIKASYSNSFQRKMKLPTNMIILPWGRTKPTLGRNTTLMAWMSEEDWEQDWRAAEWEMILCNVMLIYTRRIWLEKVKNRLAWVLSDVEWSLFMPGITIVEKNDSYILYMPVAVPDGSGLF